MNETEWTALFDLIEKATNLPNMTANEKAAAIRNKAERADQLDNLEEFSALTASPD